MKILLTTVALIYPLSMVIFCILLLTDDVLAGAIMLILNFFSSYILNNFYKAGRFNLLDSLIRNILKKHQTQQFLLRQVCFLLLLETLFTVGSKTLELAIFTLGTMLISYYWLPSVCRKVLDWKVLSNLFDFSISRLGNIFNPSNPVIRNLAKKIFVNSKAMELSLYVILIWNSSSALDSLLWVNLVLGWFTILVLTIFLIGISRFNLRQGANGTFELLMKYKPTFLFHFSAESPRHLYQIEQWLPSMEESGHPHAIITRELNIFLVLCETHQNVPILYIRNLRDLERTISDSVKGIMYVNPGMKNSHFLRLRDLTHVQLGHGESDKLASAAKQMRSYDIIAVAGQGAVERFDKAGIHINPFQFEKIGRPQLKGLQKSKESTPIATVMYAPTWESPDEQNNYSSVGECGLNLVNFLSSHYPEIKIIVKLHPLTGSVDKSLMSIIQQIESHLRNLNSSQQRPVEKMHEFYDTKNETPISRLYDKADCLICDISSVLGDFLYTIKPSFVFDTKGVGAEKLQSDYPTTRGSYIITRPFDFKSVIPPAFQNDIKRRERLEINSYIFEDSFPNPDSKFFELLKKISG